MSCARIIMKPELANYEAACCFPDEYGLRFGIIAKPMAALLRLNQVYKKKEEENQPFLHLHFLLFRVKFRSGRSN